MKKVYDTISQEGDYYGNFAVLPQGDLLNTTNMAFGRRVLLGMLSIEADVEGYSIYGFYINPKLSLTFIAPFSQCVNDVRINILKTNDGTSLKYYLNE
ncbi:MAG: hypothetical protein IJS89_06600 [Bacteroidaceae bacterium]|nr:hypothetical protein [Bacteroidaceae bacterium]